ncbi:HAMP domain-containing sensor histidine kinase [Cytobacillus purgationiresistens]|uniref:histidine kinase n=1 Tax=Cytobacillus purgationiresistens TaxID=863449 RepID=A0ABU0AS20_9BACI|nr:HAMP domain-containing sensor histidine kinase [Cytobacillus purgationiresistens]MDQ0273983.1 signal transduction histidine kinase [Cytobacillus purgationiresistens]
MRNIKRIHKLSFQLLGAITLSLIVSILVIMPVSRLISYFIDKHDPENLSIAVYYSLAVIIFFVIITTFIATFIILISKKLRYLKLVSNSIHKIANGEIGLTIELRGKDELTQLADNINYMSKELNDKFEKERALEQEKNELITNVSHDLRTPLTSIIGYLDLLKKGHYSNQQQLQDYLEITYQKSNRLKILIDELFEYTRLANQDFKLNKNVMDIGDLLEQIIGEYLPIIENEQLLVNKLIENSDFKVFMDVERLVRVFDNLINNAIKYSDKPSEITISLQKKENHSFFQILNKVEQPPSQDINKLFERFYMGDTARMGKNGSGLGLAISKRIIELHSGEITADYQDQTIIFQVKLPLIKDNEYDLKNS